MINGDDIDQAMLAEEDAQVEQYNQQVQDQQWLREQLAELRADIEVCSLAKDMQDWEDMMRMNAQKLLELLGVDHESI